MPILPDKYENTEVFRRWWKDVAEYYERSPQFLGCSFVSKKIRGYQENIDSPMEYIKFFEEVDKSLPSGQLKLGDRWGASIADKELLGALKHVFPRRRF